MIQEHTKYFNSNKIEVPSVTTILKIINKPAIAQWANYLGFHRKSYTQELNQRSIKGSMAHHMISQYVTGQPLTFSGNSLIYKKFLIDTMDKFITWYKKNKIECIQSELSLSTDLFGGTLDLYCLYDNKHTIIDFKSNKEIYIEMILQLAGYAILLEANGFIVEQVGVVSIAEGQDIKTKFISREKLEPYIETFLLCLNFYNYFTKLEEAFK